MVTSSDNTESWCVDHSINDIAPKQLNIVVLTFNALSDTKRFLASIKATTTVPYNIWFFDNASTDETPSWLQSLQDVNIFYKLSSKNWGVPGGRNRLIDMVNPHLPDDGFMVFMDNDLELTGPWAQTFLDFFDGHPKAGMAGSVGHKIFVKGNERMLFPTPVITAEVDVVSGGFVCWISAATIRAVGHFDEALGKFWHEDDDFAVRSISKGYRVYSIPNIPVIHHEHASGVANDALKDGGCLKNQAYLVDKWKKLGLINEYGLIDRDYYPSFDFSSKTIAHGIIAEGITANLGGYYLVEPLARMRIPSTHLHRKTRLSFSIHLIDFISYESTGFTAEIWINGNLLQSFSFNSQLQFADVEINLASQASDIIIEIKSSGSTNPHATGLTSFEADNISLTIENLTLQPCEHQALQLPKYNPDQFKKAPPKGILWIAPIFSHSPLSTFFRDFIRSAVFSPRLGAQQVEVYCDDYSLPYQIRSSDSEKIAWQKALGSKVEPKHVIIVAPPHTYNTELFIERQVNRFYGKALIHLIIGIHNKNLSHIWTKIHRKINTVCVLGEHSRLAIVQSGIPPEKVSILPIGFDKALFQIQSPGRISALNTDYFNIYTELDFSEHDNWEVTVLAFAKAFSKQDNARLLLRCLDERYNSESIAHLISKFLLSRGIDIRNIAKIQVLDLTLSYQILPELLRASQCYFTSAKNRMYSIITAYQLGIPVIAPYVGDQKDVLSDAFAFPVKVERQHEGVNTSNIDLQTPNLNHAISNLKQVFRDRNLVVEKTTKAQTFVLKHTGFLNTESALLQALEGEELDEHHRDKNLRINTPQASSVQSTSEYPTIGLDVRSLAYDAISSRGIGHYITGLLGALVKSRPDWNFNLYMDHAPPEGLQKLLLLPNVSLRSFDLCKKDPLSHFMITDPMSMIPHYDSPMRSAPQVPTSIISYDFIPLLFPDDYINRWADETRHSYMTRISQIRASQSHIFNISEATQRDVEEFAHVPASRMSVILAGLNTRPITTDTTPSETKQVLSKFNISKPYFLYVGALDLHKDPPTMFQAFYAAKHILPEIELVIVGSFNDPLKKRYMELLTSEGLKDVIMTGFVDTRELTALYRNAISLVFCSKYEGFGFPVLEAMANGCPVITTEGGSLREVVGSAGIVTDVGDVKAITQAMIEITSDDSLRDELREKGLIQAAKFSWERTAQSVISVWEQKFGLKSPKIESHSLQNETTIVVCQEDVSSAQAIRPQSFQSGYHHTLK